MKTIDYFCKICGSRDVRIDAWAAWDVENQRWELAETYQHAHCQECEGSTTLRKHIITETMAGDHPMRTGKRSNQQLQRTSSIRREVFDFMARFGAQHLWTINGPLSTDVDEIIAFAYEGGLCIVQTMERGSPSWSILTEPSLSAEYDVIERDMRCQVEERKERPDMLSKDAYMASLLVNVMKRLLVEVDQEIDSRKYGGNDEAWVALNNLSSTGHELVQFATQNRPADLPHIDLAVEVVMARMLLAENQDAWDNEEDSVREEHADLIARNKDYFDKIEKPPQIPNEDHALYVCRRITEMTANENSEPDVMAAALKEIRKMAEGALKIAGHITMPDPGAAGFGDALQ